MSRLFRVAALPVLLALPMVAASLDPAAFFREPRCLLFFALMVVGLAIENALVDAGSVQRSLGADQRRWDRYSFELAALTNVACYYAPVYDWFHLRPILPRGAGALVVGLSLMLLGEGLRIAALRTLGRFFTMRVAVLEGHRVVRDGLYRWVRHPAYTGWFLLALGVGIFFGSLVGVLGTSLFVLVLGWRVKVEEAALLEQLGDEYRRYMSEVRSRFVPGVF
jgi:protein-S-isoprenylcysteine O-methyltransferase Ste14